ncbi:MAG: CPBP family intramembrane metalloprotease, partial [Verrucomicrobiaceae bacterium]
MLPATTPGLRPTCCVGFRSVRCWSWHSLEAGIKDLQGKFTDSRAFILLTPCHHVPVRGEASSDVVKVWLYAAASVLLGAWFSPILFNAGKALAEVSQDKQTNGPLESLAKVCGKATFPEFFSVSVVIAAVLLFLPFVEWLRGGRTVSGEKNSLLRLAAAGRNRSGGQRLLKNQSGVRQIATGFAWVTGVFFLIAGVLLVAGIFAWKPPGAHPVKLLAVALTIAFGLAIVQELLFRGIAMGIFLRAMRPAAALGLSAAFFAIVHFMMPPQGVNVVDSEAPGIGFELLGKLVGQFSEPRAVFGSLLPLLALGFVLSYSRWRTACLCLPIGIHAGWIFANGILGSITVATSRPDSL